MAPAIASLAPKKMSATRKIRSHLLLAVLYKLLVLIFKDKHFIKKNEYLIVKELSLIHI